MRQRRCLAEHPFETMKWMMGMPRFLVRGLMKVRGEFALSVLTYNLKRVIDILGGCVAWSGESRGRPLPTPPGCRLSPLRMENLINQQAGDP